MNRAGFRINHWVTVTRPTELAQGRPCADVGHISLSRRGLLMALAGLFVFLACHQTAAASAGPAARQRPPALAAPLGDSAQRTPAQKKVSSQLLAAMAGRVDNTRGALRGSGVDVDAEGRALVDIDATVTDELLDAIVFMEAIVVNDFPQYDAVRAWVPLAQVESLAERSDVRFIRQADIATTNSPGMVPQDQ